MLITDCPRCSESLLFDEINVPGDTLVFCPRCRDEFAMDEVFASLPPRAELRHHALPIESSADHLNEETIRGGEFVFETLSDDSSEAAAGLPFDDEAQTAESVAFAPTDRAATSHPRRQRSSAFGVLAQTLLGLLIAVPTAGAILWGLGKPPNLGFWPFDGSTVSPKTSPAALSVQSDPVGWAERSPANRSDADRQHSLSKSLIEPVNEVGSSPTTAQADPKNTPASVSEAELELIQIIEALESLPPADSVPTGDSNGWRAVFRAYSMITRSCLRSPSLSRTALLKLKDSPKLTDLLSRSDLWILDNLKNKQSDLVEIHPGVLTSLARFGDGSNRWQTPSKRLVELNFDGTVAPADDINAILAIGEIRSTSNPETIAISTKAWLQAE